MVFEKRGENSILTKRNLDQRGVDYITTKWQFS